MDWRLKAVVQSMLEVFPGGDGLHTRLQQRFGGHANFGAEVLDRFWCWKLMLELLSKAGTPKQFERAIEVGTGWYPLLPMCLFATGSKSILTYDVTRHCTPELIRESLEHLLANQEALDALIAQHPQAADRMHQLAEAISNGQSLADATEGEVEYVAPTVLEEQAVTDDSVGLIFSNNVLAHIPPELIVDIHKELHRVISPDGFLYHSINCNDQNAHFDKSIHNLNYLKYSDRVWQRWNNKFLYQNRLRASQFESIIESAGFRIINTEKSKGPITDPEQLELAPKYRAMDPDDVLTVSLSLVAVKA